MAERVTFIHASDAHIGAPFRGFRVFPDSWVAKVQSAPIESFERLVRIAHERMVDFVVLSGDTFDLSRPSYGDRMRFIEGLRKLGDAGIPVYLVTGNHDPFTFWQHDLDLLPAGAHLLGIGKPTFELYEREGKPLCLIGGRSYYNQTWPADERIAAGITRQAAEHALNLNRYSAGTAPFAIGVIHSGFTFDTGKAPSSPDELEGAGIDYWACGHLHHRFVYPNDDHPHVVFPGCLQARDIKEEGEHGCFVVTLEQGKRTCVEFVPTASIAFYSLEVDVSACATLPDVLQLIRANLFRANGLARCEDMIVRIKLTGKTALHAYLSQPGVIRDMRKQINDSYPSFYCDALVDGTRSHNNRNALRAEGLFSSVVMGVADAQRVRKEEMVNFVQSEFVKRGIPVSPSIAQHIGEFQENAEGLVLDLLAEEAQ